MLHLFCPNYRCSKLSGISIKWLQNEGIKAIILDLDNTLVSWNEAMPTEENSDWIKQVKQAGIFLVLLSNNGGERLLKISRQLDIPAVGWGAKPLSMGFKRALKFLRINNHGEVLVIGDQIMTDVFGAKKMDFKVVWVESLSQKEFIFTRFTRKVESMLIKKMVKKGIMPRGNI